MTATKPWWASRTVWAALVAALTPVLSIFGILPAEFVQSNFDDALIAVSAILAIYYRVMAKVAIAPEPGA